ncbi:MAG: gliding motility-associated C-terminal domain-containing protein [Flavobacteriales bacterium]
MKSLFKIIVFIFLIKSSTLNAQVLFYQDVFYGGVTAGGFSTGQGQGLGTLNLYIEPGSTIRKAFLFTYRIGYPPPVPITVNGTPYWFDTTNILMNVLHLNSYASPIQLYYLDITDDLNASITSTFSIDIPNQFGLPINWAYCTAYLYILYENPLLSKVSTCLFVNDKNFYGQESYNFTGMNPINNSFPAGLGLNTDRAGIDTLDGSLVDINSNFIGLIGGTDTNNWQYNGGVRGHFYYQNNTLLGLDDDTPDNVVGGADGLVDYSSYILNNDIGYSLELTHVNLSGPAANRNVYLTFANAYSTPCDTFSVNVSSDTSVCFGESIQLSTSGGSFYNWYPASGLNNPGIANPNASPDSTTLYIVTISDSAGCSRTAHVKVTVNQLPVPQDILITPSICGNDDGMFEVQDIQNNASPYQYDIGAGNQFSPVFSNLAAGNYNLTIMDSLGCSFDTLIAVNEINPVIANFSANPNTGIAPLPVDFLNNSTGANNYIWYFANEDTSYLSSPDFVFDSAGLYQVMLIAYNNFPQCADTFSLTVYVYDSVTIEVPNVFSPNEDGVNDVFTVSVNGAVSVSAEIINRWGEALYKNNVSNPVSPLTLWDGRTNSGEEVSEGVYYYVIVVTGEDGREYSATGFLHLFK